jgi:hypothetical protein
MDASSEIDTYNIVTKSNDDYFESYEDFTVSTQDNYILHIIHILCMVLYPTYY